MTNITEQYDPSNGRKAIAHPNGNGHLVIFGSMQHNSFGGFEFVVSRAKTSRLYKTARGSHNAMVKWVYNR